MHKFCIFVHFQKSVHTRNKSMIRGVIYSAALLLSAEAWAIGYEYRQGKGLELSWQTDDKIGITTGNISYGEMEQLTFWASSRESASRLDRSLYAVGYQLKPATTYYTYSPFRWIEKFDAHNILCRYDQQMQSGNGSTSGLASCDYQMAQATVSATEYTFPYRHIGGVMRISFLAPAAMTIAELSVTTETTTLATVAVMDIINKRVSLDEYSDVLTLKTENISVAKGEETVFYISVPAQDLSSTALSISVKERNGNIFPIATILGPDVKAGKLYDINLKEPSRTAARTIQNVQQGSSPSIQAPKIQRVAGIANPLAHTEDILLDSSYSVQYVQTRKKGDVNGDGDVDVLDAIALIGYYTKGRTAELSPSVCDMNGDGDIDVLDAIEIVGRYTKGGS